MNAYTTIEESKQLIEAGLDVNTADMLYLCYKFTYTKDGYTDIGYHPVFKLEKDFYTSINDELDLPCWSLAALLDIIDDNDIPYRLRNSSNSESGYFLSVKLINQEGMNKSVDIVDFDKIIGCVTWLLERNYVKSNKNE